MQHCQQGECNDLAFGSMLIKSNDFDLDNLSVFKCALWIATSVLKVLPYCPLAGLELLNYLAYNNQALFVYGGYWQADYVYPEKSQPHILYGRSSNQEMVQVPKQYDVVVDNYVFLRPQQSKALIPRFAKLYAYAQAEFAERNTFRE